MTMTTIVPGSGHGQGDHVYRIVPDWLPVAGVAGDGDSVDDGLVQHGVDRLPAAGLQLALSAVFPLRRLPHRLFPDVVKASC